MRWCSSLCVHRTSQGLVTSMVETLQQNWQGEEPLEVVTRLVREALDRLEREETLLVLLAELEESSVTDPVAYLRGLVRDQEQQRDEALVNYQRLPYSHLVGIQTPGAMRERWRRAIWTIMRYNQLCKRFDDRWYINAWTIAALFTHSRRLQGSKCIVEAASQGCIG